MTDEQLRHLRTAPDWRWRRAEAYIKYNHAPSRQHDDALTKRAFRFMKRLARGDARANVHLERDYPELYMAHTIWDNPKHLSKWIIEAGILAGKSHEGIGDYLAIPTAVIAMYEQVFFDARWALDHKGWLISTIFYPSSRSGFLKGDPDQTWKVVACWGGWEALCSYMASAQMPPNVVDYFNAATSAEKKKNEFIAAHVTEINSFNAVDHLQLGLQDKRLEKEFGGQAVTAIESSIGGLMDAIQLEFSKQAAQLPCEEPRLQALPSPSIFLDAQRAKAKAELQLKEQKVDKGK